MAYADDTLDVEQIYIEPPDTSELTDEDSGEEDGGGIVDNLSGSQLRAPAEIQVAVRDFIPDEAESFAKIDHTQVDWIEGDFQARPKHFPRFSYQEYKDYTPTEVFELFMDNDIIDFLVSESNKYGLFKNMPDPMISRDEIKCFLAILVNSGYNTLPGKKYYWDQKEDMKNHMIADAMRRDRFLLIFKCLHCADNNLLNKQDKMSKLRPFMDQIRQKFISLFVPEEEINYDESMIKYFGKHSCKQFIRGKPIRFGYKAWCVNTSSEYLVNFTIYQGCDPRSNEQYQSLFGKAAAPFVTMIDEIPLEKKVLPYSFYFDNLFTSFSLLSYLKSKGFDATGTIRENRIPKNCPLEKKSTLKTQTRGSSKAIIDRQNGVIVIKWIDNNVVNVASTTYGVQPQSVVRRFSQKEKKILQVPRPHAVGKYNSAMGGTDLMDENISRYRIALRGKKWWWCIFTWMVDATIQNAWIVYKKAGNQCTQLEFRRDIVETYLTKYKNPPKATGRPSSSLSSKSSHRVGDNIRYDNVGHLLAPTTNKKKIRCAGESCSSIMRTICTKCNIGLCINCNVSFHTK